MSRVCLVVDHPLRDLDGLVLVAAHLADAGVEVFLVPMYEKHEVWLLRPDVVVLNYLRYAHASFLQTCLAAGIGLAVLDTEGGVRGDFSDFARQVEPFLTGVGLYCVWGRVQHDALQPPASRHHVRVMETGTPRYDFAVEPWRSALRHVDVPSGPMVLVNTNFPLINSRFQSVDREVQELVRTGHDEALARARITQTYTARDAMLDVVRAISTTCPSATVVIRPHPFEAAAFYDRQAAGLSNVLVRQAGPVFEWIARACVLVHHNCSTAIEAMLMAKEPVMIDWLSTPLLFQAATAAVSHRARAPQDLMDQVAKAVEDRMPAPASDLLAARDQVISDFFHANDGQASARASQAIAETIHARTSSKLSTAAYGRRISSEPRDGGWIQRTTLVTLGNGAYRRLRVVAGRARPSEAKHFTAAEVADIMSRLSQVRPEWRRLSVRPMEPSDLAVARRGNGASVRVAAP